MNGAAAHASEVRYETPLFIRARQLPAPPVFILKRPSSPGCSLRHASCAAVSASRLSRPPRLMTTAGSPAPCKWSAPHRLRWRHRGGVSAGASGNGACLVLQLTPTPAPRRGADADSGTTAWS